MRCGVCSLARPCCTAVLWPVVRGHEATRTKGRCFCCATKCRRNVVCVLPTQYLSLSPYRCHEGFAQRVTGLRGVHPQLPGLQHHTRCVVAAGRAHAGRRDVEGTHPSPGMRGGTAAVGAKWQAASRPAVSAYERAMIQAPHSHSHTHPHTSTHSHTQPHSHTPYHNTRHITTNWQRT